MKRIERIIRVLNKRYKIRPWREEPFKVLIGTVLSQRTKDEITSMAWKKLFSKANTPEEILKLSEEEIIQLIKPVGFYKQKARRIKEISKILLQNYGGKIPNKREELMKLPGVGGKTADIVLSYSYGQPVIGVDTHVSTISRRLDLTKSEDPEKIREDLHKLVPKRLRLIVNSLFVEFGKEICQTRKPKCYACPIIKLCPFPNKVLEKIK